MQLTTTPTCVPSSSVMNCAWLIGRAVLEAAFLLPAAFFFSGKVGCFVGAIVVGLCYAA